jgi:hypothetical protein
MDQVPGRDFPIRTSDRRPAYPEAYNRHATGQLDGAYCCADFSGIGSKLLIFRRFTVAQRYATCGVCKQYGLIGESY